MFPDENLLSVPEFSARSVDEGLCRRVAACRREITSAVLARGPSLVGPDLVVGMDKLTVDGGYVT